MDDAHILIVEDQNLIAWDLKSRLLNLGYEVSAIVASGEDAIERVQAMPPDLVLMDIRLKGDLDGIQTAAEIQSKADVPIIYLTAHSDESTATCAMATDPYGYILKPFEDRELRSTIELTLRKHRLERQLRESERRFRAILENVQLLAVTLDRHGRITFANDFLLKLTNWQSDEIFGRNWFDLFVPDPAPIRHVFYSTIDQGEMPAHYESEILTRAGELRIIAWNNTILRDPQGRVIGLASLGEDVTERRRRERELEAIATLSAAPRAAPTRVDMFPVIVNFARSLLSPDGVALVLHNASNDQPEVVCATGVWESQAGQFLAPGLSVAGQIIATGQPYHISDRQTVSSVTLSHPAADVWTVTGVPLIAEHETIGALVIGRHAAENHARPLNDKDLLSTIGNISAIALYRTSVLETLEQRVNDRTRELAEANERLTELDRLKSKFVADVSHELRTPVANLKLYLGLLERGKPEKRDEYAAILREQAARLTTLIEDILDLARLEDKQRSIACEPVDLNALAEHIVISQQPNAERLGLALSFEPALDLPRVQGHRNRLAQLITNLISNAINYTRDGKVQLQTYHDEMRRAVGLEVQDTGTGIDPEDLPHIFERFYRGKRVGQSNIPGTGLGLGIVKEIVDQHSGAIEVESQVGQGSTFRVWLPMDPPASVGPDNEVRWLCRPRIS